MKAMNNTATKVHPSINPATLKTKSSVSGSVNGRSGSGFLLANRSNRIHAIEPNTQQVRPSVSTSLAIKVCTNNCTNDPIIMGNILHKDLSNESKRNQVQKPKSFLPKRKQCKSKSKEESVTQAFGTEKKQQVENRAEIEGTSYSSLGVNENLEVDKAICQSTIQMCAHLQHKQEKQGQEEEETSFVCPQQNQQQQQPPTTTEMVMEIPLSTSTMIYQLLQQQQLPFVKVQTISLII